MLRTSMRRAWAVGVSPPAELEVLHSQFQLDPPPNLVAAISFAGGRGSRRVPMRYAIRYELVRAFGEFGRTSHVPMLWVYAENDHFFGPQLAAAFYAAFTKSGGKAEFIRPAAFGKDGHGLFSNGGIPLWTPLVDEFLAARNLKLRDELLALPSPPDVAPPGPLAGRGLEEWRNPFSLFRQHRAFCSVSGEGHYGYTFRGALQTRKLRRRRWSVARSRLREMTAASWLRQLLTRQVQVNESRIGPRRYSSPAAS